MMTCACTTNTVDYAIDLIQGDYGSYVFEITDSEGTALENVSKVVFTCARLKYQQTLEAVDNRTWALRITSAITETFTPCTCTYDITILFNDDKTPYTVIHDASIVILKKENKLHEPT